MNTPILFCLIRHDDETGVSGTGHVATGVEFEDGTVAMRWRTGTASTAVYDSVADVIEIHGHGGKTTVAYITKYDKNHAATIWETA